LNVAIDYLPVITTAILLFVGFVSFLIRGWIKYVNENITKLWTEHDEEGRSREGRWQIYHNNHRIITERVARLEGRLNSK